MKNLRQTKQKKLILDIISRDPSSLSAEQIHSAARLDLPSLALTTVYRNLESLVQQQKISRLIYPDGVTRYQTAAASHEHQLFCLDCGKHAEIPYCPLECLSQQIESDTGYAIVSHKIDLYGYCADCQKKKTRT